MNHHDEHGHEFPKPIFLRGRRGHVYWRDEQRSVSALFRDPLECRDHNLAYVAIPGKRQRTNMGHLDVCHVLEPCRGEEYRHAGRYVAVKVNYCSKMDQARHSEDPLVEVSALQLVHGHPNIISVEQVLFDGQALNLILPYCSGGTLQQQPNLSCFAGIVEGVQHLHSLGICHRDLSLDNVLLDENGCAKIIDLGLARRSSTVQGVCGKFRHMAPEVYRQKVCCGKAADVRSLGTLLFCLLTGSESYRIPYDSLIERMVGDLTNLLMEWDVSVTDECLTLLQGMLTVDPEERMTIEQVAHHPWLQRDQK